MSKHTYIEVSAQVRYWEDATINGEDDADGTLTPFRRGELWCPVIRLDDGLVMDWPAGMEAEFHFKVCDAGEYFLLDDSRRRVAKWAGHYVPEDFLCHGDNGYGDYIIFSVGPDGFVKDWRRPVVEWGNREDDDGGWKRPTDLEQVRAAAPQLLEALQEVLAWGTDQNYVRAKAACDAARAAIATATQAEGASNAAATGGLCLAERDRLRADVAELLSCLEIIKQRTTHTTYRIGHDVHRMAEGLLAKHQKGASNGK